MHMPWNLTTDTPPTRGFLQPLAAAAADVAELLPPAAARKLRQLRDAAVDGAASSRAIIAEREKLQERSLAIGARIKQLTGTDFQGGQVNEKHPELVRMQVEQKAIDQEYRRQGDRYARASDASNNLRRVIAAIEMWLATLGPDAKVINVAIPAISAKGSTPEAVATLRARIADLRAARAEAEAAALTVAEARSMAAAEIEKLAESGRPSVAHLIEVGHPIAWRKAHTSIPVIGGNDGVSRFASGNTFNSLATIAWLLKPQLIAAIDQLIDDSADDAGALDSASRAARIADIDAEILSIEREECAVIHALQSLDYRPDTDPRAALAVVLK